MSLPRCGSGWVDGRGNLCQASPTRGGAWKPKRGAANPPHPCGPFPSPDPGSHRMKSAIQPCAGMYELREVSAGCLRCTRYSTTARPFADTTGGLVCTVVRTTVPACLTPPACKEIRWGPSQCEATTVLRPSVARVKPPSRPTTLEQRWPPGHGVTQATLLS